MGSPTSIPSDCLYSKALCIGSGVGGICLAIQLKEQLQCTDIHLYDRNKSPGGVWAVQKYPGAACDIPADFYSFSFALARDWSSLKPPSDELEDYFTTLVTKHDLWDHMTFRTECKSAVWIEEHSLWLVTLQDIETSHVFYHASTVLCTAVGLLVDPKTPDIPGLSGFQGRVMHSARWDRSVDLKDKNVVVFGNGCSGSQLVPQIVPPAKSVVHIIRSAPWIFAPAGFPYGKVMRWILRNVPFARRLLRLLMSSVAEFAFRGSFLNVSSSRTREAWKRTSTAYLERNAPTKYIKQLTPDYEIACKRPVYDSGYLKCLHDPKVKLISESAEIFPNSVRCGGVDYPADVIVFATGFVTNNGVGSISIRGRNGLLLTDHWDAMGGPEAYDTVAVHGFPNLFFVKGPNTGTGHTSAILVTENVVNLIIKLVTPVLKGKIRQVVEVKLDAEKEYSAQVQKISRTRVWYSGCVSWYITASGWNATLYPWSQIYCWWRSMFPRWRDWTFTKAPAYGKVV